MEFAVETITPSIAHKLLDETEAQGFTNRSVRKNKIVMFAHDMEDGLWQITHQPVAITDSGAVLDGQHRLMAVVAAGVDVQMLVMRGADPETFKVLDTGAVRTTGDSLKVAGYSNVNHLAAIVRGYIGYRDVIGTTDNFRAPYARVTTSDVFEFLEDPKQRDLAVNAQVEASRVANGLARYGLKTSVAMSMMCCRLLPNELGNSTVAEFYARLTDGAELPTDSPILALRRWFMHEDGYAKIKDAARRPVACANLLKGLNDYALGKPRKLVIFRIGIEPWTPPLPKGSRRKYEKELEAEGR
jgi:hypothetical protein